MMEHDRARNHCHCGHSGYVISGVNSALFQGEINVDTVKAHRWRAHAVQPITSVCGRGRPGRARRTGCVFGIWFHLPSIDGGDLAFEQFDGRPLLVVNTASKCGYTKQYDGLQAVYDAYKDQGLVVIGIPSQDFAGQEFDDAEETKEFCTVNFGINFPMSTKQHVKGDDAHPFYKWAVEELGADATPQWNFHKILIDRSGQPVKAYRSKVKPQDAELISQIEALL